MQARVAHLALFLGALALPWVAAAQDGGAPAAPDAGVASDEQTPGEGDGPADGGSGEPGDAERSREYVPVWDRAPEGQGEAEEPTTGGHDDDDADDAQSEGAAEESAIAGEEALESLPTIRYELERIEIRGNDKTADFVVLRYVPFAPGDELDVDDPRIEALRYRLLGTGYFDTVDLSLTRGSRRGRVVLVITVTERNTILVEKLQLGISRGVENTSDVNPELLPYLGLTLAETNLLGTGISLSLSGLVSERQQGVRLRFNDPTFLGSRFSLGLAGLFNNAREFFGNEDVRVVPRCPAPPTPMSECPVAHAVVFYRRYGVSLGSGYDVGSGLYITLDWQPEIVDVLSRPDAASSARGTTTEPIDFSIRDGTSFLSTLRLGIHYDNRDDPAMPNRGSLVHLQMDGSSPILGSDYNFLKVYGLVRHYIPMPWGHGHTLRLGLFGGVLFGDAPFFFKFYLADLTDLIPSRILEMNVDDRGPPNLLGTSIAQMRGQELAGRVDFEYSLPIYQGHGGLRGIYGYFGGGLYTLADRRDLALGIPGYEGAQKIPIDLTFDFGFRIDTSVGMFQVGFSSLLGFLEL